MRRCTVREASEEKIISISWARVQADFAVFKDDNQEIWVLESAGERMT